MTVCVPEPLLWVVILAAVFRGGLRDWFEHSPRFKNGAKKSQDGDG